MGIRFGTDGWRGIVGEEVTADGIAAVSDAIAWHLQDTGAEGSPVIVGFDCRRHSAEFARVAADTLIRRGLDVFLSPDHMPTPVVAYAVRALGAAGGIVITASHNPSTYNGLKFIPAYAGPATAETTRDIENRLQQPSPPTSRLRGRIVPCSIRDRYIKHVCRLTGGAGSMAGLKVVVDPLHGAGSGYVDRVLSAMGCTVTSIHELPDPEFGGRNPDPCADNLGELAGAVQSTGSLLGLALDGDGDRLAACDGAGTVYGANQLLPLIYSHLLGAGHQGDVARTVATTHLLDVIALRHGRTAHELPVGFKHVGPMLMRPDVLLAGEESGGVSIQGHIPDKDGILGAVLVSAVVREAGVPLAECWRELAERYGVAVSIRNDVLVDAETRSLLGDRLKSLAAGDAEEFGCSVRAMNRIDGLKVEYEDRSWWLVRPSGTEPVVRIYVEAASLEQAQAIMDGVMRILDIEA